MTLVVAVFLCALLLVLPRRLALLPLFLAIFYVPMGNGVVLLGGHFHAYRLVLLAAMARVLLRGEATGLRQVGLDRLFVLWVSVSVIFGTLVKPSMGLLVSRLGPAYDALSSYFFVRCIVRDWADMVRAARLMMVLAVPLAISMLIERTGHNPLAAFGGVAAVPNERGGHFRSQGCFLHPIIAGSVGASLFPLAVGLFVLNRRYRREAVAGGIASLLIVVCSASSGPLLAWLGSVVAFGCWKVRRSMRLIRWAIAGSVVLLALVMKAPVWYVFARLGDVVGGSGWHRAYVIDVAVKHLNEWWLFGTLYTAHWGPGGQVILGNPNMMDITNHFVQEGVDGGLLKMGLFIALMAKGFQIVGRQVKASRGQSWRIGFFFWAFGVVLFAHFLSFLSITYFDQSVVFLFWLYGVLGLIQLAENRPQRPSAIPAAMPSPLMGGDRPPAPVEGAALS